MMKFASLCPFRHSVGGRRRRRQPQARQCPYFVLKGQSALRTMWSISPTAIRRGSASLRTPPSTSPMKGRAEAALKQTLKAMQPVSLIALLSTLVLLFGFQGEQILDQPLIIAMLAVPILIQVYFNAGVAYLRNRQLGVAHCIAAPSALIGASNFFELAVATAIVLFGFNSGAALATVVGVLVEVPVMLSVVHITMRSKAWYERAE